MRSQDFVPDSFKAVFWTPKVVQFDTSRIAARLLTDFSDLNGDPTVLPLPPEAPAEFPRIVLKRQDEAESLQVSPARSELVLSRRPGTTIDPGAFVELLPLRVEALLETLGARPARLAIGATFFALVGEQPARRIAEHFLMPRWYSSDGAFNDNLSVNVDAHRQLELLEGLLVNSWIRTHTGTVTEPNGSKVPAVVVQRDVNTLAEEVDTRLFDADQTRNFLLRGTDFVYDQLRMYFP